MHAETRTGPARLLAAETRKLVSTRAGVAMLAVPVVYPVVIGAVIGADGTTSADTDALEFLRSIGDVLPVIWLLIGALAVAGEFRDGSIVSTLIAVPGRIRLHAAKLAALAFVAMIVTLAAIGAGLGMSAVIGPHTWIDEVSAWTLVRTGAALVVVAVLFAVIGAGVGAITRQPTAAAVGILVWMLAAENAVPAALGHADATRWVSSRSAAALVDAARPQPDAISAIAGLGVLGSLAVVVAVASAAVVERRDVTG